MPLDLQYSLEPLLTSSQVRVRQQVHMAEAVIGWEQGNQYVVEAEGGRPIFFVTEEGVGWLASLARNLWAFRTIRLEFTTPGGSHALKLVRPWRPFFARAVIEAWNGEVAGVLQQRFSLLRRRVDVLTPAGNELATIVGPLFKPWTFEIHQKGRQIGTIRKKWSGLGKEFFTDADDFGVELDPSVDGRLRQLLVAATLMVDLLWFERRGGRSNGGMGLLTGD